MTNTHKPHLDQQPKTEDEQKKQQALDTDREKPSSESVDFDDEIVDFSEHGNRLGGDPSVPRDAKNVGKADQSQSQSQKQSQS